MPTTTKMGIAYPASTDLVKDGATNMGTIATTVDAKTGLILINTTSFTGVSSQSFNNVFSANYENYKILFALTATSASPALSLRLRVAGSDASGGNYQGGGFFNRNTAATLFGQNLLNGTEFELGNADSGQTTNRYTMECLSPFLAQRTGLQIFTAGYEAGGAPYGRMSGSNHNLSTSYDGFTIFPSSGTMTGKVAVYGYNF